MGPGGWDALLDRPLQFSYSQVVRVNFLPRSVEDTFQSPVLPRPMLGRRVLLILLCYRMMLLQPSAKPRFLLTLSGLR